MNDTLTLAWGKCKIEAKNLTQKDSTWKEFPTPVESSTQLEASQGDKKEAKIEGGTNEAVKYNANTYTLTFNIRQASDRTGANDNFITDLDGVVSDEYAVRITPENSNAIHALIRRAAVNVQQSFNADDGFIKTYTFDVLRPSDSTLAQVTTGTKESITDWELASA
jgi:hypothetical protein